MRRKGAKVKVFDEFYAGKSIVAELIGRFGPSQRQRSTRDSAVKSWFPQMPKKGGLQKAALIETDPMLQLINLWSQLKNGAVIGSSSGESRTVKFPAV